MLHTGVDTWPLSHPLCRHLGPGDMKSLSQCSTDFISMPTWMSFLQELHCDIGPQAFDFFLSHLERNTTNVEESRIPHAPPSPQIAPGRAETALIDGRLPSPVEAPFIARAPAFRSSVEDEVSAAKDMWDSSVPSQARATTQPDTNGLALGSHKTINPQHGPDISTKEEVKGTELMFRKFVDGHGYVGVAEIVAAHGGDSEGLLHSIGLDLHAQMKYEEWVEFISGVADQKGTTAAAALVRHLGISIQGNRARGEEKYAPAVHPNDTALLSEDEVHTAHEMFTSMDMDGSGQVLKDKFLVLHGGDRDGWMKTLAVQEHVSRAEWLKWLQKLKQEKGSAAYIYLLRYLKQGLLLCQAEETLSRSSSGKDWASCQDRMAPDELYKQLHCGLDELARMDNAMAELAVLEQVDDCVLPCLPHFFAMEIHYTI